MGLKLKTAKLQDMVSKAVRGASNNKMIPITGLMAVVLDKGVLTLITTDASNTLKIMEKGVEGEDFYVVVQAAVFSKLVAKTTTEFITLEVKDNSLEVKGNGVYNIELPLDEEGNPIKFPEIPFNSKAKKIKVDLSSIMGLLGTCKAAVADTMDIPCLTGYYFDDAITTTDSFKVCNAGVNVFNNKILLPFDLVELLDLVESNETVVRIADGKILFEANSTSILGHALDEIDDYPIDAIKNYLETSFESVCKLPKAALLSILDRLSLFVAPYDKNAVYLTFTDAGVTFSTKKGSGVELIEYKESKNFKPFACCGDIALLQTQVVAQAGEEVELWYGHDKAVKMVSGKITQVVALLQDDRVGE